MHLLLNEAKEKADGDTARISELSLTVSSLQAQLLGQQKSISGMKFIEIEKWESVQIIKRKYKKIENKHTKDRQTERNRERERERD